MSQRSRPAGQSMKGVARPPDTRSRRKREEQRSAAVARRPAEKLHDGQAGPDAGMRSARPIAEERRIHADWDDRAESAGKPPTPSESVPARTARNKRLPARKQVDHWIKMLRSLDRELQGTKYFREWDTFVSNHDHALSRQSLRELHYARIVLGEELLRTSLLRHGHAKTVHLSRIPGLKRAEAARVLKAGLLIHDGKPRRNLDEILDADLRAYVRRQQSELGPEGRKRLHARRSWRRGKRVRDYATREFQWPDSLLTHVRSLVLAWPRLERADEPGPRPGSTWSASKHASRAAKLPRQLSRAQDARDALLRAATKLDRWLGTKGHAGTSQDLLSGPLDVLDAAWNRTSSEHEGAGEVPSKLTLTRVSDLSGVEALLKTVLAAVKRRRRTGASGRSSNRPGRPSP